ncbi:MAG: ABC transporter permease [Desulfobacter sp.]|nr:ABC transporter permease [Desulfobacter sp.]
MNRFLKKLLKLLLVVLCVTWFTFLMIDLLPGDAAHEIAGENASIEEVSEIQEQLGLNKNIIARYFRWVARVFQGDLGVSSITQEVVAEAILARLPVTIELMLVAQFFALFLAVPLGIISAYKANSGFDDLLAGLAFGFMSTPVFVMSIMFIYFFSLKLGWLPATGYVPLSQGFLKNIQSFILPGLSIALVEWVPLMRVLRSDMIATLKEDYILLARAKGIPAYKILFSHALKPSSFTLITILGIQIGHLVGGALIVEIIFALPGVGRLLVGAIYGRDIFMVQGCILFITLAYVGINFCVDAVYSILDPRIRMQPY